MYAYNPETKSALNAEGGLMSVMMSSGSGDVTWTKVLLKDGKLSEEGTWEGKIDSAPADMGKTEKISWLPNVRAIGDIPESEIQAAEAEGNIVLKGTLRYAGKEELLDIQQVADLNPGTNSDDYERMILVLPEEKNLKVQSADGPGLRDMTIHPSDTSLPPGEPKIMEYRVIR